jgi:hypothetical protein
MLIEAVLIAVDLDDDARTTAFEIHDEIGDRRLAAEVVA